MQVKLDREDHRELALWAADCAERVLHCFEEEYPEDDRPRKAIEAVRAWVRGEIGVLEARSAASAAHAAARDTADPAARAAARSAGTAAATVHAAGHAPAAAMYAVKAVEAASGDVEREWQYAHVPERLRSMAFRGGFQSADRWVSMSGGIGSEIVQTCKASA